MSTPANDPMRALAFLLTTLSVASPLQAQRVLGVPVDSPSASTAPRTPGAFRLAQLGHSRVRRAWDNVQDRLLARYRAAGLDPIDTEIYLRAIKRSRELEVWARPAGSGPYRHLATFPLCRTSGALGPKRRQGDRQIPEGLYTLSTFNPWSAYHLSLGINYPNGADRARGEERSLGGDIFVHGGCATIGCLPLTDSGIEEVYWMAVLARDAGQGVIPIHIFPARMGGPEMGWLRRAARADAPLRRFWDSLRPAYQIFEATREIPTPHTLPDGTYAFTTGGN